MLYSTQRGNPDRNIMAGGANERQGIMAYTQEMKAKLDSIVENGKASVAAAMESIIREYDTRKDYIVKPEKIAYDVNGSLHARIGAVDTLFTDHSRGQLLSKINMPSRFYDRLVSHADMKDLAAMNLSRLTQKFANDGLMFRVVHGEQVMTKGVLSPSYGRYDASPLFNAFLQACIRAGYVPMTGHNTDYRYQLTFLLPQVEEIAPGEYIVFAITFTTSDYGTGANDISLSVLRIVCTNLAQGFGLLRKVHIGSRFNDINAFVEMSETTHSLDVKTISSAINDIVGKSVDMIPAFRTQLIEAANPNEQYNVNRALSVIQKKHGKEIAESAKTLYAQSGLEELPAMPGAWRMSNVLSLLAHSQKPDTKIDLQKEAFSILTAA